MKTTRVMRSICALVFLGVFTSPAFAAGVQVEPVIVQSIITADAHIHHGFVYNGATLEFEANDYFIPRGVHFISYPMPIRREQVTDLAAVIAAEIDQMRLLSRRDETFRISGTLRGIDDHPWPPTVLLSIEYFHGVFGGDLATVEQYRRMGVRSITIINNEHDPFFSDDLLTEFGKQVIQEMNNHDILVDISHLSEQHALEVITVSSRPVIASHSASAVVGNDDGLPDAVLKAIQANGGYVFTSFNKNSLFRTGENGDDGLVRFIDHVVHLADILGADHVGIGSDYQAAGRYVPTELNGVDTYRLVRSQLKRAGFSDHEVGRVMSGTFLEAMSTQH